MFFYIVHWFFIILNSFFIFKVITILKDNSNSERNRYFLSVCNVLKFFPIAQICCIIPSTINRFAILFNRGEVEFNSFTLNVLQCVFGSITGLFYLIIYIFLPDVKLALSTFCSRVCCHKRISTNKLIKKENLIVSQI